VPLYEPLGTPRGRWVRAAELLPGDTVATRSGSATVVRVAPHARPEVVYNLHVEGTARYLVGACGVVVHNSPCSDAAEKAFSHEKRALVDMAKADARAGVTRADMNAYQELNKTLKDPFPENLIRIDEGHLRRGAHARKPHGHVGPVDYIPIMDP
jgi:hypothetical protein